MTILNKSKAIIILTNSFPYGKSEPYLITELNFLADTFDQVIIFPINKNGSINIAENKKIKIIELKSSSLKSVIPFWELTRIIIQELPELIKLPKPIYKIRYFGSYLLNKYTLSQNLINKLNLKELLKNNDITIYSYWFNDLAIISGFVKKQFPDVKTISRAHGFDLFKEQNLNNYIPFRGFQLKHIDKIYSVSKRGEIYLKEKFPDYDFKITKSYLGTIDAGYENLNSEIPFSIITCSIIRNIKRLNLMIDVLANIKFELTWHVIGDGLEEENLKQNCKKLPDNIRVIFHGYFSQTELFEFYKNNSINLFCSLSSSEGLPVSMMEAISFGIPIMSTDVGGCNEICNEQTGFLIDKEFNANDVSNKIVEFKNSQKNTNEFREKVREYWKENFSAEINYKNFIENIIIN